MLALFHLPDYPPQFWLAAIATGLLIGVSKAGFGSGPGVIATPLLSLVMPVPEAAALLLPVLLLADVFAVRHYYDQVDGPSLRALLPGALLGIVLGAIFFRQFSDQERVLKIGIGTRMGVRLNRRFNELWFNRIVYGILLLVGIQLILGQSVISLLFG